VQGRLLRVSQRKTVLQLPEGVDRDELVLSCLWWIDRINSPGRLGQGVPLRPHEDCRRLGPQTDSTPSEHLRERVPILIFWAGLGRDFPIHTPRFDGKAGPAERSAGRADL
jgi:hypothetical protein